MKFKRSWERKLDKLMIRAKRVMVNTKSDLAQAAGKELYEKVKRDGSIPFQEALENPVIAEARKRLNAVSSEHNLQVDILKCHVTITLQDYGLHLAISFLDRREPCPPEHPWVVPPKFEKIRKYLGAPEGPKARGPVAMHWVWTP